MSQKVLIVEVTPSDEDWAGWYPPTSVFPSDINNLVQDLRNGLAWRDYPWATKAYLGTQKVTLVGKGQKVRYVAHNFLDLTQRTPFDYAKAHLRAALRLLFPGRQRRYTLGQWRDMERGSYGPTYAKVGTYPDMQYVDLRAAYYTLYSMYFTVDVRTYSFFGRYPRLPLFLPELRENKRARNAVWGIARASRIKWIERGGFHRSVITPHAQSHPSMALGATEVLHAVAAHAVRQFGAVYVQIDGYIIPKRNTPAFLDFLASLGLEGRIVEEGEAHVMGPGAHRIGVKATRKVLRPITGLVDNIRYPVAEWILPRHRWLYRLTQEALGGRFHDYLWTPRGEEEERESLLPFATEWVELEEGVYDQGDMANLV